jgi:hypothetical protein
MKLAEKMIPLLGIWLKNNNFSWIGWKSSIFHDNFIPETSSNLSSKTWSKVENFFGPAQWVSWPKLGVFKSSSMMHLLCPCSIMQIVTNYHAKNTAFLGAFTTFFSKKTTEFFLEMEISCKPERPTMFWKYNE